MGRGASEHGELPEGTTFRKRIPGFEKDPEMAIGFARSGASARVVRIVGGFSQEEAEEIVARETPYGVIGRPRPDSRARRPRRLWRRNR